MNDEIKSYITTNGQERYKFIIYLGRDEKTGRSREIRKQGYKSLSAAQKDFLRIQIAIANGDYSSNKLKHLKFKELYDQWLPLYAAGVKQSSLATTTRIMENHVLPALGKYYIDRISVIECQNAVNRWFKIAPRTYKRFIRYANKVFIYAKHLEIIDQSPMSKVIRPKTKKLQRPYQFYDKEQLKTFLHFAKKSGYKQYAFFRLLAYSGLRRGEALGLKWQDLDFINNTLSVQRTVSAGMHGKPIIQSPKTSHSLRTISMDRLTMNVLRTWQAKQERLLGANMIRLNQFVFEGFENGYSVNKPMAVSTPYKWNAKICQKWHLKQINLHGFRHTHASLLFDAGIPMQDVRDRLGHSSIQTTMNIYTHVYEKTRRQVANTFAAYME